MIRFPSTNNVAVIAALSLLILQTVLIDITVVNGDDAECGSDKWEVGDPYGTLVEGMLNDLAVECAEDPNHVKNVEYSSGEYSNEDIVAYGSAACTADLSEDDCKACLASAQEALLTECPFCKTASVTLTDCFLSYSNNPLDG